MKRMKQGNQLEKLSSKPKMALQILLSILICFHLIAILVLPNNSSFLGRSLDRWLTPYGNLFGFQVAWNFFAPDPAHTMYIHYFVHFDSAEGEEPKETIEGYIPPEKEEIVIDSSKRRFLYAMRFMIIDEKRLKVILGPFLCRRHPGASSIRVENILEPIQNLDLSQMVLGEKREATLMEHTYDCHAAQDEVAL